MSPTSAGGKTTTNADMLEVMSAANNNAAIQEYQGNGGYMMWKRKRMVEGNPVKSEAVTAKIQKIAAKVRAMNDNEMLTPSVKKSSSRGHSRAKT